MENKGKTVGFKTPDDGKLDVLIDELRSVRGFSSKSMRHLVVFGDDTLADLYEFLLELRVRRSTSTVDVKLLRKLFAALDGAVKEQR